MPDRNHPAKVPGLTSGAFPNADHPNTRKFEPTEAQKGVPQPEAEEKAAE